MKHIRPKFLFSEKVTTDSKPNESEADTREDVREYLQNNGAGALHAFIITETERIQGFVYDANGNVLAIPEPNPVILYFSNAHNLLNSVIQFRKELFLKFSSSNLDVNELNQSFSLFFSYSTTFASFLYNSLEAFLNYSIPIGYIHHKPLKSRPKNAPYNREDIQRWSKLVEKLDEIIPLALNKSFDVLYQTERQVIIDLSSFRNDIMHTKHAMNSSPTPYSSLFIKSLDFNYEEALRAVQLYFDFYDPGLIEFYN